MIDYKKIQTELPEVWNEFEEFISKNHSVENMEVTETDIFFIYGIDNESFNDRDLYDFFDSVGIIVILDYNRKRVDEWGFRIRDCGISKEATPLSESRSQSEADAFTRAFSTRNDQLNHQKGTD